MLCVSVKKSGRHSQNYSNSKFIKKKLKLKHKLDTKNDYNEIPE